MRKALLLAALLSAPVALLGCSDDDDNDGGGTPVGPGTGGGALIGIDPAGDATGIGTNERITLIFDTPMDTSDAPLVDLHSPDIAGAVVEMDCDWLNLDTQLVCSPIAGLAPNTTYLVHLAGGGFRDAGGELVTIPSGAPLNGTAVGTGTGGTHGGQPFTALPTGWADASGGYGTAFTFTTGAGPTDGPVAGGTGGDGGTRGGTPDDTPDGTAGDGGTSGGTGTGGLRVGR